MKSSFKIATVIALVVIASAANYFTARSIERDAALKAGLAHYNECTGQYELGAPSCICVSEGEKK